MTNKETKMTIKELEAWSLFAAHAATSITKIRFTRINDKSNFNPETIACDAASIADKLLEERRNRMSKGKN